MWQLLGRIDEVLELSRFVLIRAHDNSAVFELIDRLCRVTGRKSRLFGRERETGIRWM